MKDQKWVQVNKSEHKVFTIYFNTCQHISEIDNKIKWVTYLRAKEYAILEMSDLLHLGMGRCYTPNPTSWP